MPKPKFTDSHFIMILFVFTLFLSYQTYKSVFFLDQRKMIIPLSKIERQPQSLLPVNKRELFAQKIDFDLLCGSDKRRPQAITPERRPIEVKSPYVHLKGKYCNKNLSENQIEIKNDSNGFFASIFDLNKSTFRTDFIHLKEGENKIIIHYLTAENTRIEQVVDIKYTP